MHEHLARRVVGRLELLVVPDHRDPAPAAAVERLHEQRVPELLGDAGEVERLVVVRGRVRVLLVVQRVLVGHEHGLRHLQPEPDHRAVGSVLLHRLERVRAVEQVHVVHHRDLLQPLPRVVVPVREAVDDEVVARLLAQRERLDRHALDVERVAPPTGPGRRRAGGSAPRTRWASRSRCRAAARRGA